MAVTLSKEDRELLKKIPDKKVYVYMGLSDEAKEALKKSLTSSIDYPDSMKITDREAKKLSPIVTSKTKQQERYMKQRMEEVEESIETNDLSIYFAGMLFKKDEPKEINFRKFGNPKDKLYVYRKAESFVDQGAFEYAKPKKPVVEPPKYAKKPKVED